MSGIVAIVGRPNVGKSTLFNRLIKDRKAIVDDMSGVTRDRHYGIAEWNGVLFSVIDTGGYVAHSEDIFEAAIREQVDIAIEEADALIFMVDITTGLTALDQEFAAHVRKSHKPVFLVTNKTDNHDREQWSTEFYALGLGEPWPLSSLNGAGTGDLLDAIVAALPPEKEIQTQDDLPRFAVVGRPNVGKSSLINTLTGQERNIVTPIAGTTRDSLHTRYSSFGHDVWLVDTAGLRKRAKVQENIEFYSTLRSIRAIEDCDVAILMLDATQGIEAQDLSVLQTIEKSHKGLIIVVNKWDLIEKDTHTAKAFTQKIEERIQPLSGVPILFISCKDRTRVLKVLELATEVYHEKKKMIPTHKLNEAMQEAFAAYHPPAVRGKLIKIKYVTQVPGQIPTFLFFCNYPKLMKESYKRYLENQIRARFGFKGVPMHIFFRDKN